MRSGADAALLTARDAREVVGKINNAASFYAGYFDAAMLQQRCGQLSSAQADGFLRTVEHALIREAA